MPTLRRFLFLAIAAAAALSSARAGAEPALRSYFTMQENFSGDVTPFPKWTGVMQRFAAQKKISDAQCGKAEFHPCVILDWKKMIEGLRGEAAPVQAERINSFANAFPYITDQMNWGMEDFWETPYEFLSVSGDCEDYAIAKYYSLRSAGIPPERLRIIIVQDFNLGGVIHAVLGLYTKDGLLILDNQIRQVMPALEIYHYKPIYAINEQGWWAYHP